VALERQADVVETVDEVVLAARIDVEMQGAAVRPLDVTLEKAASIDAYEQKLAERPWA
jgi:hypothetical protein